MTTDHKYLFVPYVIAIELKEKGFSEPCFAFYAGNPLDIDYVWVLNITDNNWHRHKNNTTAFIAPTYFQVIDWFIKKHNIFLSVGCNASGWYWNICKTNGTTIKDQNIDKEEVYETHHKAYNEVIHQALKLI